jgi:hypothetical protein
VGDPPGRGLDPRPVRHPHDGKLPLNREGDVCKASVLDEPVLLVESESSVDALRGHYATTWAGGAANPKLDRRLDVLRGYPHLIVIPDHDDAGLACLAQLQQAELAPHVLLPEPGEDARECTGESAPKRSTR